MNPIWSSTAALAVAVIFYIYRAYLQVLDRKQRKLRERVAYMLWVMASGIESGKRPGTRQLKRV
jgi:hypothetical protein